MRPLTSAIYVALPIALSACSTLSDTDTGRRSMRSDDFSWSSVLPDPISAGTTFESPVIETDLEAHVIHQNLPKDSIFGGGYFNVYALQGRYAVNDKWAIIATKDGYIDLNPDVGESETGWADIAAGFKTMVYEDRENGVIVTPGFIVETDVGNGEVFQGNGDGLLRPFVSAAWDDNELNLIGSLGYNHPLDSDAESSSLDYHAHVSYEITRDWLAVFEFNGITYTSDGDALPVNFEGGDLINLGAGDVSGNSVFSGAIGAAYRIGSRAQLGLTYEQPIGGREDLLDDRIWVALLVRF